jgi:ribose transport system permease protein
MDNRLAGPTGPESAPSGRPIPSVREISRRIAPWGTVISLVALIFGFGLAEPDVFLTTSNLRTVLGESAHLGIVAAGLTLVLISWDFDLSVGAMATLSGLTIALLLEQGVPMLPAIVLAVLLGSAVGLANGLIVAWLNVSAFIATLAMMTIVGGVGRFFSQDTVPISHTTFLDIDFDLVLGIPLPAIIAILVFIGLWVLLERTKIGRLLYAVGANPRAAYIAGIPVRLVRISAFVGASSLAALAGVLIASRLSGGYHGAGDPLLLMAFAAVFLGAVTIRLGQFHILGTAIGILILAVMRNGLDILGWESYVIQIVTGLILIVAVAFAGISKAVSGGAP